MFGSFWLAVGTLIVAEHYRDGTERSVERPGIGRRRSECQVDCANLIIPGAVELPARGVTTCGEMPGVDELLESVRDFLRGEVMDATGGRLRFMARVASNSLDIVLRDRALGPALREGEHARLEALLGHDGARETLRRELVAVLRDGRMALDTPGLAEHLRTTVVGELAIDQPQYSGLAMALAGGR